MSTSGTTSFNPATADLVLDAYARLQIRPASILPDHMFQARMSCNLLLSEWATRQGPMLWKVDLQSVPLANGVATYSVPSDTLLMLDVYLRQYNLGSPVNMVPAFSTDGATPTVTIAWTAHGQAAGNWIAVVVPVSIGGLVIQGFYPVVTVIDANTLTISASTASTSAAIGGVVPECTTTAGSSTVQVTQPSHGLVANQSFTIQVPVSVGGVSLNGAYTVGTVIDANNFTISAGNFAGAAASVFENTGQTQLEGQVPNAQPIDLVLGALSRTEWAAQPNKQMQGRPTVFWFNRQIAPTITLWEVPNGGGGPYSLYYYRVQQIQDASIPNGTQLDIPYRFLEAFASGLAAKLAVKFPPPPTSGMTVQQLEMHAERAWQLASAQDVESTPIFLSPGIESYTRLY